jgi:hypothetical protein
MFSSGTSLSFPTTVVPSMLRTHLSSGVDKPIEDGTPRESILSLRYVCYLESPSLSTLHSVDDRMINEYRVDGGMIIGRGNRSTRGRRLRLNPRPQPKESKVLEADEPIQFQDTITKH